MTYAWYAEFRIILYFLPPTVIFQAKCTINMEKNRWEVENEIWNVHVCNTFLILCNIFHGYHVSRILHIHTCNIFIITQQRSFIHNSLIYIMKKFWMKIGMCTVCRIYNHLYFLPPTIIFEEKFSIIWKTNR